jgi:DNA-binding NarL/FixJ family response regulator
VPDASPHHPRLDPLCVAIIDGDETARDGLAAVVDGTAGLRCVGRYGSLDEARRTPPGRSADVVLLDINLPGLSAADGVGIIRSRFHSAEVVMLTEYAEDDRVFEWIRNGAAGHVLKSTTPARLLEAIEDAATGGVSRGPLPI